MHTIERIVVSAAHGKHFLLALLIALMVLFLMPAESGWTPDPSPPSPTGRIIGRIELVPGVPMTNCQVQIIGIPLSTKCDNKGRFKLDGVLRGTRDVGVKGEWVEDKTYFPVGVNKDAITTVTLVVSHYGAIIGKVINAEPKHLAEMYVTIADFGIVAKPDANGYYVLDRVPPGCWVLILHNVPYNSPPIQQQTATVQPKQIT